MDIKLTHTDNHGKASMVNVGQKSIIKRSAVAEGMIFLAPKTIVLIKENDIAKGDVLSCARIAGIIGAKKTSELIPLCHNILIDQIKIDFTIQENGILIRAEAYCTDKTGIEMEALTAVSIAGLTIWDMCKAVDKNMEIRKILLVEKKKEEL